jgi:transposase
MSEPLSNLPDDTDSLKGIILSLQEAHNKKEQSYQAQLKSLEDEISILSEQVRFFKARLYARNTEKLSAGELRQMFLFDEAEAVVDGIAPEDKESEGVTVAAHTRRKSGRKALPESLPRVEVVHDLSEEEKRCECGCIMGRIGEDISEKLDIIPARIQVIRHIRYKYACKGCEGVESEGGAVSIAPLPPQLIPQGIATAGLLSYILISKFADALPFYRQEKIFARIGVEIGRATMSNWAIHVARSCEPLLELMWQEIRSGPVINMDETPVQVLKEPGRSNTNKSYMWVFRGGNPDHPLLLYRYDPSRAGRVPEECLGDYTGYIQTDGYKGYNAFGKRDGIVHLGCFAHVRRKFLDAAEAGNKAVKKKGYAYHILTHISKLYAIEKKADKENLSCEERCLLRQKESMPVLEKIKGLLDEAVKRTPPRGLLGKAVAYALDQWERLVRYIEDGRLRPDNNLAENAIRPFVVGRKNWLFSGSPRGARASAAIYSLIETAKANGLEPYQYLRYIFENIPQAKSTEDLKALLPMNLDRDAINKLNK